METLEEFITEFRSQFDALDGSEDFSPDSYYREIDGWDSLTSIMVLGMIEEKYDLALSSEEYVATKTIEDLFEYIQLKIKNRDK